MDGSGRGRTLIRRPKPIFVVTLVAYVVMATVPVMIARGTPAGL